LLLAFHNPYWVLSQFTAEGSKHGTLAQFQFPKNVYPIVRLDADSEGLLLLSNEPLLNQRLLNPVSGHPRTYWAQVERIPDMKSLARLSKGISIQDYWTRPCQARILDPQPQVGPRNPPIRIRKNVPDVWIELVLTEGKNRQVRHMTAAIGHPTLRLIRVAIGSYRLGELAPGTWKELNDSERKLVLEG
jgi:23S rRNA pseudouridine2457 synthase